MSGPSVGGTPSEVDVSLISQRPSYEIAAAPLAAGSFADLALDGAKVLVVASTGGHIAQAMRICSLANVSHESHIVTFDTPQTQRLTEGRPRTFVPYIRPRDLRGVLRAAPTIRRLLRENDFDAVLSTGAAVALAALPVAVCCSTRAIYVESFARFNGPSRSGQLVSRMRGVETYTQHEEWQDANWRYVGDVMPRISRSSHSGTGDAGVMHIPRVLVTLGTLEKYRFDALAERLVEIIPANWSITWQLGATSRTDLPGRVFEMLPADEFTTIADECDVVISHGGVGSALSIIELGKTAILVPRRAARAEHVDDHQVQLCSELARRDLALYREVDELTTADLEWCLASGSA